MRKFYFDLAKICFGVGFYGCVTKLEDPTAIFEIGILSLSLAVVLAYVGFKHQEEE